MYHLFFEVAVAYVDEPSSVLLIRIDSGFSCCVLSCKHLRSALAHLALLHLFCLFLRNSALIEDLVLEGGACFSRFNSTSLAYSEVGNIELFHTVVYTKEIIVGKLAVLLLALAHILCILRALYFLEQIYYRFYQNFKAYEYYLDYHKSSFNKAAFAFGEKVRNIYGEYCSCDYDQTDFAECADEAESNEATDKSAAHAGLCIIIEIDKIEVGLAVPVVDSISERGDRRYSDEREYNS